MLDWRRWIWDARLGLARLLAPPGARIEAPAWTPTRARDSADSTPEDDPGATGAGRSRLPWLLFALSLAVYAFTRLSGLPEYPIYFHGDEAIQPLLGRSLAQGADVGVDGDWLPVYFRTAAHRSMPILPVYLHRITAGIFGMSIFVTRASSALVSLLGVAAVALTLRRAFGRRHWWLAVPVMAALPAWFLHSRTAFEAVVMSACYALTLLCYLRYRLDAPRWLYPALILGAASFYSYSNGQMITLCLALALLIVDARYHWQHRATWLRALPLALVLALPFLRYQLRNAGDAALHLRALDSYWLHDIGLAEKLGMYAERYLYGLSPQYWLLPNAKDIARHRMDGLAHLPLWTAPFLFTGLLIGLRRWREPAPRTLLLSALAVPVGASLVDIGITRVLALVVPFGLWITLGLDASLEWLARGPLSRLDQRGLATIACLLALLPGLWLYRLAMTQGATWHTDYGLYGMQYGARQLYETRIPALLASDPELRLHVSPLWANEAMRFAEFFLSPDELQRVDGTVVDDALFERRPLEDHIYVMTPEEHARAERSDKLAEVELVDTVLDPTGQPAFYLARLRYTPDVDERFAADAAARRQPVAGQVTWEDQTIDLLHSRPDMGRMEEVFDGDDFTLVRGLEANPFIIELDLSQPRAIEQIALLLNEADYQLEARLHPEGGGEVVRYEAMLDVEDGDGNSWLEVAVNAGPPRVARIELAIEQVGAGEPAKIHIYELALR